VEEHLELGEVQQIHVSVLVSIEAGAGPVARISVGPRKALLKIIVIVKIYGPVTIAVVPGQAEPESTD
jgi:hypothetical protein